jgi:SAM-dependent methyltransferase
MATTEGEPLTPCPVCRSATEAAGEVLSQFSGQQFQIRQCPTCKFTFVANPRQDFDQIYTADYYHGRGADPLVDYYGELQNPKTIRRHEWSGILKWVSSLTPVNNGTCWLDYGSGAGGLVTFLRAHGVPEAIGYEPSPFSDTIEKGLDEAEFDKSQGRFDIVTAIEVIEHVIDPVAELRRIRHVLKPGGMLVLTTGNAAPYRGRITSWRYVSPDIHVSFFEPGTLARALREADFEPQFPGFVKGWNEIIRFKILKNLHRRSSSSLDNLLPWPLLVRLADRRYGLSAQPIGVAR